MWFYFNNLYEWIDSQKVFSNISFINPVLQPAIAGMICGLVSVYLPEVIGLGTGAIQSMINGKINLIYAIYFLIF